MKKLLLFLLICSIVGYGFFEARRLLEGPQITIEAPQDGTASGDATITVSGTAHNISFLTINDSPAFTDEDGQFSKTLSPPKGTAAITVKGTDRFGRRTSAEVHITTLTFCPLT